MDLCVTSLPAPDLGVVDEVGLDLLLLLAAFSVGSAPPDLAPPFLHLCHHRVQLGFSFVVLGFLAIVSQRSICACDLRNEAWIRLGSDCS